MPAPYIEYITTPRGILASVVVDQADFDQIIGELVRQICPDLELLTQLVQKKHIPLLIRTDKTSELFDRLGIRTNYMCVIVRGTSETSFILNQ